MDEVEQQGRLSVEEEKKLKQQAARGIWDIARKEAALKKQSDRVSTYEEAFAKIQKEVCGGARRVSSRRASPHRSHPPRRPHSPPLARRRTRPASIPSTRWSRLS